MPSGITTNLSKRQEHLVNDNIAMKSKITSLERKTTDQELELIKLKRRLNKLERPA
jgi:gluconate kinase